MNTTIKQDQKNQRHGTRQKQGPKKQGSAKQGRPSMLAEHRKYEDHEHPETRLTR